jgi:hypothetical protein
MPHPTDSPGDPRGHGQLRASDADRELVAEILRQAAGDGRLTLDELDQRLVAADVAKTYAELEELTEDLPAAGVPAPTGGSLPVQLFGGNGDVKVRLLALGLAVWVAGYAWVYVKSMRDQGSTPYWWYLAIIGAGAVPPLLAAAGVQSRRVLVCGVVILAVAAVLALPSIGMLLLPAVIAAVAVAVLSPRRA